MIALSVRVQMQEIIEMIDISFSEVIQEVDLMPVSQVSDEKKLRRSGELIYQGSLLVLEEAESLWELTQRAETTSDDVSIDDDFTKFLASFTQQTISTEFFSKYLQPQVRANYQRDSLDSSLVRSLSTSEALTNFAVDLIESEVLNLAHDENIEEWIEIVDQHLQLYPSSNELLDIVSLTNLTVAQVFVAALFGQFMVIKEGNFYEPKQFKLVR